MIFAGAKTMLRFAKTNRYGNAQNPKFYNEKNRLIENGRTNAKNAIQLLAKFRTSLRVSLVCLVLFIVGGCASFNSLSAQISAVANDGNSALLDDPRFVSQMKNSAEDAYQSGDWRSAILNYQRLLRVAPSDAQLWLRLGNALTQAGSYTEALAAYHHSLSIDNEQHKVWFNQSTAYLLLARSAAINSLHNADQDTPTSRQLETRLNDLQVMLE